MGRETTSDSGRDQLRGTTADTPILKEFGADSFANFADKYLFEGTLSQIKMKAATIIERLAQRVSNVAERFGFNTSISKSQLKAWVECSVGDYNAGVVIYDDDDFNIELNQRTAEQLDMSSYSSFKTIGDVSNFLSLMAGKIKERKNNKMEDADHNRHSHMKFKKAGIQPSLHGQDCEYGEDCDGN